MVEHANPEMITLARESRGLSQVQLAEALGVTQGKVSKLESGTIAVSPGDLDGLTRVLKYPEGLFLQTDEVRYAGSACMYHRKRQTMPVAELRRIQAQVNLARMQISRLLRGGVVESSDRFFRLDIDESEGGPEGIAQEVRRAWGLRDGPIPNLIRAVEKAGGIVLCCPFGSKKIDAISQWVPGLPPLFFVNRDTPVDRRRFSLAHEIGHVVMHQVLGEDAETQADAFASELLMPAETIRSQLHGMSLARAALLKPHWRTSMAALIRRARDLGCLSESNYRRLFTELGQRGMRTSEPASIAEENPSVLTDLVQVHLRSHGYTLAELAHSLNSLEEELIARYLPERPNLRLFE